MKSVEAPVLFIDYQRFSEYTVRYIRSMTSGDKYAVL